MNWIVDELNTADFGDRRLTKRLQKVATRQSVGVGKSCPKQLRGRGETEGAYRFYANDKVTPDLILEPHRNRTIERIKHHKVVILAQDTTSANMSHMKEIEGLSQTEACVNLGFFSHPIIAFLPNKICLGVIHNKIYTRDINKITKKKHRNDLPIEEKQSFRWLEGYREACKVAEQAPNTLIVCVSDRESDIYEILHEAVNSVKQGSNSHIVIRSKFDREAESENDTFVKETLKSKVSLRPVLGHIDIKINETKQRKARIAKLSLQTCSLVIKSPGRKKKESSLQVNVVSVRDVSPPKGEEAIEWMLLTTLPVSSIEEAINVVQFYTCRWQIEVFFRALKTGCKIEEMLFKHAERLFNCLTLCMVITWRVLYVMMLSREDPDAPCEIAFEIGEWKPLYTMVKGKPAPGKPITMHEFVKILAMFGGYQGRKSDGPPGPQAIWHGLQFMRIFAEGYQCGLSAKVK